MSEEKTYTRILWLRDNTIINSVLLVNPTEQIIKEYSKTNNVIFSWYSQSNTLKIDMLDSISIRYINEYRNNFINIKEFNDITFEKAYRIFLDSEYRKINK